MLKARRSPLLLVLTLGLSLAATAQAEVLIKKSGKTVKVEISGSAIELWAPSEDFGELDAFVLNPGGSQRGDGAPGIAVHEARAAAAWVRHVDQTIQVVERAEQLAPPRSRSCIGRRRALGTNHDALSFMSCAGTIVVHNSAMSARHHHHHHAAHPHWPVV